MSKDEALMVLRELREETHTKFTEGLASITTAQLDILDAALSRPSGADAEAYTRSGVRDRTGREIRVGDAIRIDLTGDNTKQEYWRPEYRVEFKAPSFVLKHIGGGKDSDTARFYFNVPQESSTPKIETLSVAAPPLPEPVAVAPDLYLRLRGHADLTNILTSKWVEQAEELLRTAADAIAILSAQLAVKDEALRVTAWLGEGDGFNSFTRKKSVAARWVNGGIKVTPVAAALSQTKDTPE